MAEQGSSEPSAGTSECISKSILINKSDESNSHHLEFTEWLAALEENLQVTQTTCLELKSKQIGVTEAAAIYKLLCNSQIIDLSISCNENLKGGMEDLLQLLLTSKIKRLSFCPCMVSSKEFLHLMGVLKNTHLTQLIIRRDIFCKLSLDKCFKFDSGERDEFMSHLLKSRLTRLDCNTASVLTPLVRILRNSSVTDLTISKTTFHMNVLSLLFSTLHHSALTNLKLCHIKVSEDGLKQLSLNLRDSSLVELILSDINLSDAGLDILAESLAHSKITSLDISENRITGSNSFGLCLKDSQISNLNLRGNCITSPKLLLLPLFLKHSPIVKLSMNFCNLSDELGQQLIKCLRFSKVTHLTLSGNRLGLLSITELAAVIKDTALNSVDFYGNCLQPEGVILLADCLKGSNLKAINVGNRREYQNPTFLSAISTFLSKTKDTSLEAVGLNANQFDSELSKFLAASLVNTTFTHLNLCSAGIKSGIVSLAAQLKFTTITHLNLRDNDLYDAGAQILARCIAETQIIKLVLAHNYIGDCGAKVLANCLKDSKLVHLDLADNKIGNEGLENLAKHAEGIFLKILDVRGNLGNRDLFIDRILLENQTSVHHFVSFFKQIAPETNNSSFRFDNIMNDKDVKIFLEECLLFYKAVLEQPSAASVLVAEDSSFISMEKIFSLLKEESPRQFTAFVANQIEASPAQHVSFLKRAEELELTKIVELLLFNRPAFMIDKNIGILDPYVYQLLHKYKQPLFNTSVEPEGKSKIIEYFTEHSDLDGAFDVINILNSKRKKEFKNSKTSVQIN